MAQSDLHDLDAVERRFRQWSTRIGTTENDARAAILGLVTSIRQMRDVDYMDEPASCDHCHIPTTRRGMFIHIQHPCPELLASQLEGERIIAMIQEQTEDPAPF